MYPREVRSACGIIMPPPAPNWRENEPILLSFALRPPLEWIDARAIGREIDKNDIFEAHPRVPRALTILFCILPPYGLCLDNASAPDEIEQLET